MIPTKMTIIAATVIGLGVAGAVAVLALQQSGNHTNAIRDTSGEVLNATATSEEQSAEVRVNGKPVQLDSSGNAHVPVPESNGTVTITENGKQVTTQTHNAQDSNASGSVNVNVSSQSEGGSNFTNSTYHYSDNIETSVRSEIKVRSEGRGKVDTSP